MDVKDFDFYLPEELIAQHPLEQRDSSRLMVLDKKTGEIKHKRFHDIIEYLNKGDTLVLNNTRVMPARLIGEKEDTGGKIEFLLFKRIEKDRWECLALRINCRIRPSLISLAIRSTNRSWSILLK